MNASTSNLPSTSIADQLKNSRSLSGVTELPHLGIIRVAGEDAVKFLQGQLTQDVALMGLTEARLAAFCNAKGRMQASFVVFKRSEGEVLMVCSQDILAQTLKRLSMFVMRAKAKLSDATADFELSGLTGTAIDSVANQHSSAWTAMQIDAKNMIFLFPAAGVARALWCAPAGTARPTGAVLATGIWDWLEVQSGIAMITLPTFEAFVPQMLNYESVGGVNFKKGCYPGQEIVARSQFRGTLKRRAYIAHGPAAGHVGQEVFSSADASQPCGMVAAAAANPAGGFAFIVSMQTAAAASSVGLALGAADGPALTLTPLPYSLLDDI